MGKRNWPDHRVTHIPLLSPEITTSVSRTSVSSPPSFTVLDQSPSTQTLSEHKLPTTPGPAHCPHAAPAHPGWTPSPSLTRAPHTSILLVLAIALPPGLHSTVPQGRLPTPALHLIQPDAPISRAKCCRLHGFQGLVTAQLLIHHLDLCQAPGVIAHGAPGAAVPDLHPP